ncbi:assimilatory sulfite reductase (NADPH) flavoprotein subunit [Marilutibacter chinensis]|uniref:Assimilatory sulfite reductase (NADPH) flavoprotein subunit n=1 Tax=Marilutibacter chinensis TaxID=2912247 RepID=A0ABS9HVS2_9GAMM|nr:assimilatory sulfite reductase (NADPH) flavoprotein subunit [Lysobacter chinensis]MCF7222450.1 assimilatory sulfite reductase (NADPH) flavoprotein subunit [Lysobacter chinensis]
MPASPAPAPLTDEQSGLLTRLTDGLDGAGLWWISGYAAGLARAQAPAARMATSLATTAVLPAADATPASPLTIVYGSQTGNARRVAEKLAAQAEAAGAVVRLLRADAYPTRELKDEKQLYIVISTQGEGDPPDDSIALVEFIRGRRAPKLPQLRYAVLGLGDSSYPQFCEMGRVLDERLAELGATRLFERGEADLDIDSVATPWLERAVDEARAMARGAAPAHSATVTPLRPLQSGPAHDRDRPFQAELLASHPLSASSGLRSPRGRDVRHFELSLEGSGLHYQPGDALGVWPRNPPALIDEVLATLKLDGDTAVAASGEERPLRDWLDGRRELTRLSRPFLAAHAERCGDAGLQAMLQPDRRADLARLFDELQVIDLLRRHPAGWDAAGLVAALRPMAPRLYSIASSQKHVGDEVHLTVAHVEYDFDGRTRWGTASNFLARAGEGARLPVYIEPNERFRLPADPDRDIIMVGPGTGVAPFRAFVQERTETAAGGRNWLFFGNPHFRTDFLYQLEWQRAIRDGRLHRLDLAFSRDKEKSPHVDAQGVAGDSHRKIYVQRRLREQGRAIYDWLENGAHFYVCGAIAMGKDVHAALLDVIATHGGQSREDAEDYLGRLQQQGRYARDVY